MYNFIISKLVIYNIISGHVPKAKNFIISKLVIYNVFSGHVPKAKDSDVAEKKIGTSQRTSTILYPSLEVSFSDLTTKYLLP